MLVPVRRKERNCIIIGIASEFSDIGSLNGKLLGSLVAVLIIPTDKLFAFLPSFYIRERNYFTGNACSCGSLACGLACRPSERYCYTFGSILSIVCTVSRCSCGDSIVVGIKPTGKVCAFLSDRIGSNDSFTFLE